MRALAKEVAAGLALIAIGTVVSLAVALPHQADASPDPGVSYVWRGLSPAPSGLFCYPWGTLSGHHACWHYENYEHYTAIDYSFYDPDDCTDEDVWLDYTGDFQLFKMAEQTDYCTGVRAKIYLGSYAEQNYKGDLHYLHIEPNDLWLDQEVPYQLIYIGDVLEQELDPYCPWTDAHLHQSARITAETPFYTNKLADPTEDDNWQHAILWEAGSGDEDGDEFTNAEELYIDTDAFDDCPDVVGSHDAWPADINIDRWVNSSDIIAFSQNINMPAELNVEPTYDARYDLSNDGWVNTTDILIISQRVTMPLECTN
jgi:hypothetical protein